MRVSNSGHGAFLLSLLLACGPVCEAGGVAPIGKMTGDPKVKVNGQSLSSTQLAFPGDVIEAPGAARGSIEISPNSVARLTAAARASLGRSGEDVWVGLQNGYVSVREGDKPVSVRAHGGRITAAPGSVFDVAAVGSATIVTAVKGSVLLSEGGLRATETVPQGQSVKVAFLEPVAAGLDPQNPPPSTDPQQQKQKKEACLDPCKTDSSSQECKQNKALKKQCKGMEKACGKDSTKCADYQKTCSTLAGCPGFAGLAGGAAGSAASASAASAAAASAAASAGASVATVAATAAAVAGAAVGVAVPVAAAGGSSSTINIVSKSSMSGTP